MRDDDDDPRVVQRQRFWLNGGSALPLLELLVDADRLDEAAATARLALAMDDCADREAIEAILRDAGSPPVGWDAALATYAADPSDEHWGQIVRFIPEEVVYQRIRNTVAALSRLGADPDRLFLHASRDGIVPELLEIAESGAVAPDTIRSRGEESPHNLSFWLGLAAQSAFARGDRFLTVRLLTEAYDAGTIMPPDFAAIQIRAAADPELHEMLDAVRIPRFDETVGGEADPAKE
ncbi:MAG: hypothetical protein ACRD2J_15485 [Thermoanaerobaculia bacterium]